MESRKQRAVRAGFFPVFVSAALLLAAEGASAARDSFQPSAEYTLRPPYNSDSFLAPSNFKRVKFALTTCRWARTEIYFTKKPLKLNYPERTVTATVPDSLNLADPATVDGLLVAAWQRAWETCPAIADVDGPLRPAFHGVRVIVVQQKNVAIDTERTTVSGSGVISTPRIENAVMARVAERQRQHEEAVATQQRQAAVSQAPSTATYLIGSIFKNLFTLIVTGVLLIAIPILGYKLLRNLPKIIGYIRYFFTPHPAGSIIDRSTRRELSRPLDGPALASALKYQPGSRTERELATDDLRKMTEEVRQETEFLSESEKLARMAVEMEKQRARVDALKEGRKRT